MNSRPPDAIISRFRGEHTFLGNFHMEDVTIGSITYKSAEHAFQARKTWNWQAHDWVMSAPTAAEAKKRGRQVPLRPYWDQYGRYVIMDTLTRNKFKRGTELGNRLVITGDAMLIEGNDWHDNTWGDCRCGRASCAAPGMNLLGFMLMKCRGGLCDDTGITFGRNNGI